MHELCQDKDEDPVQMIEIKNSVEKKNSQFNRVSPQLGLEKKNFSKLSRKIIIGCEAWPGRCAHCHISEMAENTYNIDHKLSAFCFSFRMVVMTLS